MKYKLKMKIIQIMPEFGLAGAETMCENLIYELKRLGEEVIVISLFNYNSAITERLEKNNIKILYLNKKKGFDISIFLKLLKIFKSEKPDVVHTHRYVMQYVIPISIISGIKCKVHTIHSIAKMENSKLARKVNKLFYKYCGVIPVALSKTIQETVKDEYKLSLEQIPIIFNGINLQKCVSKKSYKIKNKIKILHIGRFSEVKNHIGLVNAFEKFHEKYINSELNLIGTGEIKERIEKEIKDKKMTDSIHLLGTQENVYSFLNDADIFVLPSLYEGIPMSLLEAMGTGLPIIASNVGGIPDLLNNNEEAILIKNDVESIKYGIETLVENEKLREFLGKKAKEKSKNFSSSYMAKEYLKIYKKYI